MRHPYGILVASVCWHPCGITTASLRVPAASLRIPCVFLLACAAPSVGSSRIPSPLINRAVPIAVWNRNWILPDKHRFQVIGIKSPRCPPQIKGSSRSRMACRQVGTVHGKGDSRLRYISHNCARDSNCDSRNTELTGRCYAMIADVRGLPS